MMKTTTWVVEVNHRFYEGKGSGKTMAEALKNAKADAYRVALLKAWGQK